MVAVLGHIDHGKTTLLDSIRKTRVTAKEAGGITQSIGAYQVDVKGKGSITFIDTPGHEAFQNMRSHGAKAADIALLVIAGDDGVKPQTIEAIEDIKQAEVPFIVVFTKMDKPGVNVPRVKQELAKHNVLVEGFGGQVSVAEVSATKGVGIDALLDLILLTAEVEGLEADVGLSGVGVVIASHLDPRRGGLATLIVKNGTIRSGDWVKLESTYGKIKMMENFEGKTVKEAAPATPVRVLGIKEVPEIGEQVFVVDSETQARRELVPETTSTLPHELNASGNVLNFVVKAGEKASLDALVRLIKQMQPRFPETTLQIVSIGLGDISTSDVDDAEHFGAMILGFQVHIPSGLKNILKQRNIAYRVFPIIYEVDDLIKSIVEEREKKESGPQIFGELEVLALFTSSKKGQVIGGKVREGVAKRNASFEIKRGEEVVGQGKVVNLQQDKKETGSVPKGKECGLFVTASVAIEVADVLIFLA